MSSVLSDLDPRALDRAATALCLDAVAAVRPDQLDLPTPCSEWNLGELVAHLVAENRGFAANSAGVVDRTAWRPGPPDEITLAKFPASVARVGAAFAGYDVLDRPVEVREFGVFPGRVAVAMHFLDYLVHAWDVARSIGRPDPIPDDLAEAALRMSPLFPADRPAGGAFAAVVQVPHDARPSERLLGLTGRDPEWSAR
ncbi:TIGR03086 family metal-binding protein [Kribbella sancticallisti]|uniref:TIGR03086 family metal-binding protein n=1 Tax=Kribbella sancticallisti TaxID=460087 RepID=A0ABN2E6U5_9ACTN